jgi:hypothetical protein
MMAQQTQRDKHFLLSCKKCGHVKICAIFRAVGPLLSQNWDEDTRPFESEQIASICREFVPASVLSNLKEDA